MAVPPTSPAVREVSTTRKSDEAGGHAQPSPRLAQVGARLQEKAPKSGIS